MWMRICWTYNWRWKCRFLMWFKRLLTQWKRELRWWWTLIRRFTWLRGTFQWGYAGCTPSARLNIH